MKSTNYKLILLTDATHGTMIRYRKDGDQLWSNIYLTDNDSDKVIDKLMKAVKKNVRPA